MVGFNRQFQVGEKEREAVKWGWEQEMGNTMFHLVSAYTPSFDSGRQAVLRLLSNFEYISYA